MEHNFASFEKTIVLETSQYDLLGSWKLSSILEAMQDTVNEHCRKLHVGRGELISVCLSSTTDPKSIAISTNY